MDASVASEPAASPGEAPTSRGETNLINLALQGGGAHAPLLGVSSTACSRRSASGLTALAQRAPAQ